MLVSIVGLGLFQKYFVERRIDTPLNNVWEFDIGKLIILGDFFDDDLLAIMAKKYDPIT